jgi:transcriptional regulator with XRE-family HTH domain
VGRKNRQGKRTREQAAADRRSDELAGQLGRMLKDARGRRRLTQAAASEIAGLSPSTWSWLEVGRDGRVTLATWNRAATAVGSSLHAYLQDASAADQPRDAVHLRNQELILRASAPGGWQALPEAQIDREARTSRSADVLLERGAHATAQGPHATAHGPHATAHGPHATAHGPHATAHGPHATAHGPHATAHGPHATAREYALIEIWDWFDDVGGAQRNWDRRLDAVERYAIARMAGEEPLPRVGGCWFVRATQRNRRLVKEHRHFFRARFPGSGSAWLMALTTREASMPDKAALLWVTVTGDRLFPARLG